MFSLRLLASPMGGIEQSFKVHMRSLTIAFNSAISAPKPNQLFGNYRVPRHIGATCHYLGLA